MQFIGLFILSASLLHQSAFGLLDLTRLLGSVQPRDEVSSVDSTTEEHASTGDDVISSLDDRNSTQFQNGSIPEEDTTAAEIDSTNTTSLETRQSTGQSTVVGSWTAMTTASSNESHSSSDGPSSTGMSSSSSSEEAGDEEAEGVARGKPTIAETVTNATTPVPETVFQKALHLINDTYTLSILLPIAAGVLFATSILMTIATCRCLRRICRRRRMRRKVLPDSVKNMRPSDRARLLAESSDEEF